MPVDTTKVIPTRRTQRKITEEELKDIELKRIRGELSCAECRRLKLRCDKKVPCGSCRRRGCESICPCGILSAGQGTRFILADTDQLHRKISEMSSRIRQLEDALAILQSTITDQRHPLLHDELLKIKFGSEALNVQQTLVVDDEESTSKSFDALGTLTLGDSGEVKYFGRSAGSETLMASEEFDTISEDNEGGDERYPISPELEQLANLFPFTKSHKLNIGYMGLLEDHLPIPERAWSLCDSYLNHATFFFCPIKRSELLEHLLPRVYNAASVRAEDGVLSGSTEQKQNSEHESGTTDCPHSLAALYFIFALGALLDLSLPPYNAEAEHYYNLGRSSLSLRLVYESPKVETVQAMGLMATYHSLAGKKYTRDSAWCIMSFTAKLAQSIGLHRDGARWNMDPETVQSRRNLFWEVYAADVSHSLALGRPPAIHLSYVDCEFPIDEDSTKNDNGENQNGFWRMKHIFARDIFNAVAEATLIANSPSYSTVLNLDRKVREISYPASFKPYVSRQDGEAEFHSSSLSLRGFYASQYRTVTMIYLHRSFFAQAMLDHPTNPLLSPFAPSFLTAYRCASVIIKASAHQFDRCAAMAMRAWFLLYHTFSAAVIVGTVVTRSPNSNVASSALLDLDLAVDLFERTAIQSWRARVALGVLRRLKDRAVRAYTQYSSATLPPAVSSPNADPMSPSIGIFSNQATDDIEDELAIFGGQTRILDRKSRSKSSNSEATSPLTDVSSPPSHEEVKSNTPAQMPEVHPSLVEYLSQESVRENYTFTSYQPTAPGVYPGVQRQNVRSVGDQGSHIGDMYSSFVDYPSNKSGSVVSPAGSTGSIVSNMSRSFPQQSDDTSNWKLSLDPLSDNIIRDSFSWTLPHHASTSSIGSQIGSSITTVSSSRPFDPCQTAAQVINGETAQNNLALPAVSQSDAEMSQSSIYATSHTDDVYNQDQVTIQDMNPIDAMIEMGLTTESGMDAGWLSFMRDCGIMDTN